jgi:class 3 adenylate cyclase/tetratricopeptide (TPR) repeat protein
MWLLSGNTRVKLKACVVAGLLLLFYNPGRAQNKKLADSLESAFLHNFFDAEDRLELLYSLSINHPDPVKKLEFTEILIREAKENHSATHLFNGYLHRGNALTLKGDLAKALGSYFQAEEIALKLSDYTDLGRIYTAIAGVYSSMDNKENTIDFYNRAIDILSKSGDSIAYATALYNLGDEYVLKFNQPDSALALFKSSNEIFRAHNYNVGLAYNLGDVGLAYALKGDSEAAEANISQAISMLEKLGDHYPISVYLLYMSDIYASQNHWDAAFSYASRSLELSRQFGLKEQISDAYLKLSEHYEATGDKAASLKYYKDYVVLRDSVKNLSTIQEMADIRNSFELAQIQVKLDLLNQQRRTQQIIVIAVIIALLFIAFLAVGLYRRNKFIKATNKTIEQEMDKSDSLLKNILPEMTARELKASGKVLAKKFPSVSVMFTDFSGFTKHSETLTPEVLVDTVDYYFSSFDQIILRYGLEKIKTMGDSYMCAGGLPFPVEDHALGIVLAAFEIVEFVDAAKKNVSGGTVRFDVRIGINTGTVVAGVVGTNKFAYDIWGDTVNIAARMESNSLPGRINVSENTYLLIRERFDCEYRGKIDVKNKGMTNMYFVNGPIDTPKNTNLL